MQEIENKLKDVLSKSTIEKCFIRIPTIGFLIQEMRGSQKSTVLVEEVNRHLSKKMVPSIEIYKVINQPPMMKCLCGIFNLDRITTFFSDLVCCGVDVYQNAKIANRAKIAVYIYDLNDLYNVEVVRQIIADNVPVFTRTSEYSKHLEKAGFKNILPPVMDFDIEEIAKNLGVSCEFPTNE